MDDDDLRQLLHSAYESDTPVSGLSPRALQDRARGPRHRRLVASLVAVAAVVVVAVPIGVTVALRTGTLGGSSASTPPVLDLHMYDALAGWAWAGGDQILHTTSGVQHWTIVAPPIGDRAIAEVAWVDGETARILTTSAGVVGDVEKKYTLVGWMTNDGGATWTEGQPFTVLLETAQDPSVTSDLDFVDANHGWFFDAQELSVGAPIFILKTVDGGMHWSQVETTPATGTALHGALPVGCAPYGMTFLNDTTGWVSGECGNATLLEVTHDGGADWSPQPIDCQKCAFYPPVFTSPLDGDVWGGGDDLYVTTDGGQTWSARAQTPGNWPDFVDSEHGVTLGLTSNVNSLVVLWTTSDGGASWEQAPNGAINGNGPFQSSQLDFVTPSLGWVVSLDIHGEPLLQGGQTPFPTLPPELWQTTDGGVTWTQVIPTFTTSK